MRDVEGGPGGSTSRRFFGWVIGGTLPAALAADWLTSTWDQNAASNLTAPDEAVVEDVCGAWLKDLLGLPASASFAFVTGCQMAHTTARAAARHKLLRERGCDVEKSGLADAPRLRILTTESRHEAILRSVRLLGIGTDVVDYVTADDSGCMSMDGLAEALQRADPGATVVWLQAGGLDTGLFGPFDRPARSPMRPRPGSMSMAPSACGRRPAPATGLCSMACLVRGIGRPPGAEIVFHPIVNQGLVRFLEANGHHDRATDEVIGRIQAKGVA